MSWRDSASCAQSDPDTFFPEEGKEGYDQTRAALAICERCPVVDECWWDQITSGEEPWGIRGGQKPSELKASMAAYEKGGDQRELAEAIGRAQDAENDRVSAEAARKEADRLAYMEGRKERQRVASRKYAAEKRARERAEREEQFADLDDFPRQADREQDVAEVA